LRTEGAGVSSVSVGKCRESCHGVKFLEQQLEASASSGRSGAMGETTGRATGHAIGYNTGSGALWVTIINKVLTRFWILVFGRFVLGAPGPRSLILVPQASFLGVLSWALLILVLRFLSGRPRSGRQLLVLATSRGLWARYFKSISGKGSVRMIEDILLSERDGGGGGRGLARALAVCLARIEASASRVAKLLKESTGFNKNIKKSSPLIMGKGGSKLILYIDLILAR
jgi:hypothetical protein